MIETTSVVAAMRAGQLDADLWRRLDSTAIPTEWLDVVRNANAVWQGNTRPFENVDPKETMAAACMQQGKVCARLFESRRRA